MRASWYWVATPSRSTATRAPTKDLDILVEADPSNAKRVYAALAAFGAPLSAFEVSVEDFASYDGVLQIGVPPRRIDIINRADGITFAEAVADTESFELEGCAIPVIGRAALIKNKRAAGRPQYVADLKALESERIRERDPPWPFAATVPIPS